MYIEQVIIDGFKSYATRTVVGPFDPQFNAITGLNGSGKSNILDAICFVLGISNLTQVRAGSLQELVYKQGNSGITKASVSLVFNNEDEAKAPVGYEGMPKITVTREIVIGGRNKYLINGHVAQLSRVQNLFHSVQLNVNNPHFLIMQGRITKVLNMKPREVLGMIEEAAGTRMFEAKKEAARKTIAKKERKVEEIRRVLAEEITPTLENLRGERTTYLTWQRNAEELARLERYLLAAKYHNAVQRLDACDAKMKAAQDELKRAVAAQDVAATAAAKAKGEAHDLLEATVGGAQVNAELEERANNADKALATAEVAESSARAALVAEEEAVAKAKEDAAKAAAELQALQNGDQDVAIKSAEEELAAAEAALTGAEQHLAAVQSGVATGDSGNGESIAAQLATAQREEADANSEAKRLADLVKALSKEHAAAAKNAKSSSGELAKLEAKLAEKEDVIRKLEAEYGSLTGDTADDGAALQARLSAARNAAAANKQRVDQLSARLANAQFTYADPERNFDRRRVKGLVADLVRVADPRASTALEVVAGSRLYNVVVDNEVTGAALLERGKLRKRVTIIPLSKIRSNPISNERVARARSTLGGDAANASSRIATALSLVGYEDDVKAAMNYVFGGALVCEDADAARLCAFGEGVKARAVTLEGDVFDPRGTVTGGARAGGAGSGVLDRLAALHAARDAALAADQELKEAMAAEQAWRKDRAGSAQARRTAQVAAHEAERLRARIAASADGRSKAEAAALAARLAEAETGVTEATEKATAAHARVQELKAAVGEAKKNQANALKAAKAGVSAARKRVKNATDGMKAVSAAAEEQEIRIAQLQADAGDVDESNLGQLRAALETAATALEHARTVADEAKSAAAAAAQQVASEEAALAQARAALEKHRAMQAEEELKAKEAKHSLASCSTEIKMAEVEVAGLAKEHSWIERDAPLFGKKNTDYDFEANPVAKVHERAEELRSTQASLGSKINKKVMSMFEKAENEYQGLIQKRDIITNDREKIESVITELEEKKIEALNATWEKVNKDLGAIFSALLPGASAALELPPGATGITDGLEIKVSFGEMTKALSELSGGQRSLVALSLVLAMLVFKPCPFYVLDEIDAALDLHNTKNIGQVIRSKFKGQAQFIVVSLKQGMFSNANCIFRVKFVDGISQVSRTENLAVTGGQKRVTSEESENDKAVANKRARA